MAGTLATDILRASHLADKGYESILPALRHLHAQEPRFMYGPLQDSLSPFVAQRRLSVLLYISHLGIVMIQFAPIDHSRNSMHLPDDRVTTQL